MGNRIIAGISNQATNDSFLKEISLAAQPSVDAGTIPTPTPAPDSMDLPDIATPVYTEADKPDFTGLSEDENEERKPKPEEIKQQNFGKDFFATLLVKGLDTFSVRTCCIMSKDANKERWKLDEDEIKTLSEATTNYLDSINFKPSPLSVLVGAAAITFGSRLGIAYYEGKEIKNRQKAIQENAPALKYATKQAASESEEKERTDFRIYATTGAYMKNKFGQMVSVEDANEKPNFANAMEIKSLIKTNGLSKIKRSFPEFEHTITQINEAAAV